MTLGILPLARPTFDVVYAEARLAAMLELIDRSADEVAGPRRLLFEAAETRAAIDELREAGAERLLILQVTFTDAAMTVEAARAADWSLALWATPEPRLGGRLRLNGFCGLNLAAHALGLEGRTFGYLYADPDASDTGAALKELLSGGRQARPVASRAAAAGSHPAASHAVAALRGARIGRIGEHPAGFSTCAYDRAVLKSLADVDVEPISLEAFFARARAVEAGAAAALRSGAEALLEGLAAVDQEQLERSLRLKSALEALRAEGGYSAFAVRCWPEAFTEYGGAVCGPVSMMGEARVPCACEADVFGALTTLMLQNVAGAPVFLADLVDVDTADDTAVVWHCGQAPVSMAAPSTPPRATVHSNRRMPLLFEFALKPGRVTLFRLSQARGQLSAVIGAGEMLARPMAFTGTSGVMRFDSGAEAVLDRIMGAALEHHFALVYGDHRHALEAAAGELGLPVLAL
jgi:L-fucose isomerase-like protein